MGPRDGRQDEQEQALLSSLARKGGGILHGAGGRECLLVASSSLSQFYGEGEEEERRTDMKGAIFLFILQGDDGHAKSVFKVISSTWEAERFRGRLEECSESFLPLWQPIHVDNSPDGGHRGNGRRQRTRRLEQRPVGGGALRREHGLLLLLVLQVRMLLLSRRGRGCEIPGRRNSMSEKRGRADRGDASKVFLCCCALFPPRSVSTRKTQDRRAESRVGALKQRLRCRHSQD